MSLSEKEKKEKKLKLWQAHRNGPESDGLWWSYLFMSLIGATAE